ncbi:MAG: BrnA antitoxin family protein [Deltaproteobacteria bacterium]|nr:BrnA antitoxin family protein [Deltaproteobacteria bacterium]
MAKKRSASSARVARTKKSARSTRDHDEGIDYSDIPPLSREQMAVMKPLGRPLIGAKKRKMVAMRLDQDVLEGLRDEAKEKRTGYQSLINSILARYVRVKRRGAKAA